MNGLLTEPFFEIVLLMEGKPPVLLNPLIDFNSSFMYFCYYSLIVKLIVKFFRLMKRVIQ